MSLRQYSWLLVLFEMLEDMQCRRVAFPHYRTYVIGWEIIEWEITGSAVQQTINFLPSRHLTVISDYMYVHVFPPQDTYILYVVTYALQIIR